MSTGKGKRKGTTMRKVLVTAMVIGAGAIGFAAVSQAGISLRPAQALLSGVSTDTAVSKLPVSGCRIQKTLKYDFNGNPYMKKVRVCA